MLLYGTRGKVPQGTLSTTQLSLLSLIDCLIYAHILISIYTNKGVLVHKWEGRCVGPPDAEETF